MGDAGIELMAIAAAIPSKRGGVSRISCEKRSDAANVKVKLTALTTNCRPARKPQISLAFGPQESNGRDVLR